jgi:glycosyltransferase involved in cell wall biosynthesis
MDAVLAINKEEYEVVKKWGKHNERYIHGVGLDIAKIQNITVNRANKRKNFGIPQDAFLIFSIGELNRNKNHSVIIRAISKINNANIFYLICGEGNLKRKLQKLAENLGLGNRIVLAGYRRDIPQIINMVDLFVFPSFHEGLPVSLMEAMAAGLPVVCSGIRGNADLIIDGKGGFCCEPDDIDGFKHAIEKLVNNNILCRKMRKTNLDSIQYFSIETVANEIRKIYSEVISDGRHYT